MGCRSSSNRVRWRDDSPSGSPVPGMMYCRQSDSLHRCDRARPHQASDTLTHPLVGPLLAGRVRSDDLDIERLQCPSGLAPDMAVSLLSARAAMTTTSTHEQARRLAVQRLGVERVPARHGPSDLLPRRPLCVRLLSTRTALRLHVAAYPAEVELQVERHVHCGRQLCQHRRPARLGSRLTVCAMMYCGMLRLWIPVISSIRQRSH